MTVFYTGSFVSDREITETCMNTTVLDPHSERDE
jgi:hypothetical protein